EPARREQQPPRPPTDEALLPHRQEQLAVQGPPPAPSPRRLAVPVGVPPRFTLIVIARLDPAVQQTSAMDCSCRGCAKSPLGRSEIGPYKHPAKSLTFRCKYGNI